VLTAIAIVLQCMLSKAQNKYIRSLTQQKFRDEYKVFIAEGGKIAHEWLSTSERVQMIIATAAWAAAQQEVIARHGEAELHIVKDSELAALSALPTPNQVLLVVHEPAQKANAALTGWSIALDDIQDPGNMGTIIRIADWFGIGNIICSPGCVNVYNPKVVQSAMGGHLRVNIIEGELGGILSASALPKFAAVLHGDNVYEVKRVDAGILIIGNESKGISDKVLAVATNKVTIPRKGGAESLNAGVSAGILCALLLPC